MADIRVQDEQGNTHVFPDGSTPEMIAKAMNVKPPSATDGGIMHAVKAFGGDLADTGKGLYHMVADEPQTTGEKAMAALGGPLALPIKRAIHGYFDTVQSSLDKARKSADEGDMAGVMFHAAAAGIPLTGPLTEGVYDKAKSGDTSGAIGMGASRIAQAASMAPDGSVIPNPTGATMPILEGENLKVPNVKEIPGNIVAAGKNIVDKVIPGLVDPPPTKLMIKAIKPINAKAGFDVSVDTAMPSLKLAEKETGKPVQGLADALQAATIAKKSIWQQYEQRLGANANAILDGNQVADAMMNSIDRRTAMQNPGLVEKVAKIADTYRRPIPLSEAEEFLQSANNDLHNYYAKNKVGQHVAQGDPETAYIVAESGALRKGLYSRLDELSGPGAAELKKQYGALSSMEEEMLRRKNVAARQNPQSMAEQISTARGYGKIAKGIFTASPGDILEGAETIGTSKYLKEWNSTDALIARAFKASPVPEGPTVPPPVPARPPAGLLPAGPQVTPPPADISGTPSNPEVFPPAPDYTTAQMRKGRMLPERSGAPTILDGGIEMTPGEQVAAHMSELRRRSIQKLLQERSRAIPLGPAR